MTILSPVEGHVKKTLKYPRLLYIEYFIPLLASHTVVAPCDALITKITKNNKENSCEITMLSNLALMRLTLQGALLYRTVKVFTKENEVVRQARPLAKITLGSKALFIVKTNVPYTLHKKNYYRAKELLLTLFANPIVHPYLKAKKNHTF